MTSSKWRKITIQVIRTTASRIAFMMNSFLRALKSDQQSCSWSWYTFWQVNLRMQRKIGLKRVTVIPYLKPILNDWRLKHWGLKCTRKIEMKFYIFLVVQQLRHIETLKRNFRLDMELLNTSRVIPLMARRRWTLTSRSSATLGKGMTPPSKSPKVAHDQFTKHQVLLL